MGKFISNHKRRKTFPKNATQIWVIGIESRRKKYYLFNIEKGEKNENEYELLIRKICKNYKYKIFEFLTREDMYRAMRNGAYKSIDEFPSERFLKLWKIIKPDEEYPEHSD
tara:strand:+ start:453 stop:785 length:333 start_codon:yes stop_codon:yes gene_type:complete